jgi:uncharacterized protein (TIGR03000 family)
MYSVVMMMALGGSGEVAEFGRCRGCSGYCSGCYGCSGCSGRYGRGCYGGYSCCGCSGGVSYYGCRGGYSCRGCSGGMIYDGCRGGMPPAGEQVPRPKKMKKEVSANLVVTLPVDAKLTIDGKAATTNNGNSVNRLFTTPPLEVGWEYQYQLRAEILRDGQRRILTQDVTIRAGEQTRVSMMDFTNAETVGNGSP